uniref:Ovule protein n=1 Tax=Heterorhabditis bacteriophora TaxID=37862 RepID=A0A1I7WE15_HETBA
MIRACANIRLSRMYQINYLSSVSPMFKFIVTKALHYPYSYRINEKEPTDKNALMICGSLQFAIVCLYRSLVLFINLK